MKVSSPELWHKSLCVVWARTAPPRRREARGAKDESLKTAAALAEPIVSDATSGFTSRRLSEWSVLRR